MEKVVVPQFVADWYEQNKMVTMYGLMNAFVDLDEYEHEQLTLWTASVGFANAQRILAKMHLYGYEVEEEKKYYWRKKKEYVFDFEGDDYIYLNIEKDTGDIYFSDEGDFGIYQTLLTEAQVRQAVGGEDFNKLERVETDE